MNITLPSLWARALLCARIMGFICPFLLANSASSATLSLAEATTKMLTQHPELSQYAAQTKALESDAALAQQGAPLSIGLETSELAGTGEYKGVRSAETTLSVASFFETGGKREQRMRLSATKLELANLEREVATRTLISQLTQEYITSLALQEQCRLAEETVDLSQQALRLVQERVQKAASASAEATRAKAALVQTQLALSACKSELANNYQTLATAMGQTEVDFDHLQGNLFAWQPLPSLTELQRQLVESPLLQTYAKQRAVQERQLASLQAQNKTDVQWRFGVTHFAASDDAALGVGVELPLFNSSRNRPRIAAAHAQNELISAQEQQAQQQLLARLNQSFQQHTQGVQMAQSLQQDIIPLLTQAYQEAQSAYQRGRYGYSEWINARQELLNAQTQAVDAAKTAWLHQAIIEQLTE